MPKRNLNGLGKAKDFDQRQAFIDCMIEGLSIDDTMLRVGIAQSTAYKWRRQWETDGDSWNSPEYQRTRAKRFRKLTPAATKRHVIEIALENPELGASRIADLLSDRISFSISTGTVHQYLAEEGLGKRVDRLNRLYSYYQRSLPLTKKQLKVLEEIDPFVIWGEQWRSQQPGQRLVVGMVRSSYSSPVTNSLISIIVDACDGRAFAGYGLSERPGELGVYSYLKGVVDWFSAQGFQVKELVTQSHYLYDRKFRACDVVPSFDEYLKSMGVIQRLDGINGAKINPLVKHVWNTLKPHLFGELKRMCDCKSVEDLLALNRAIQKFLDSKYPHILQRASI